MDGTVFHPFLDMNLFRVEIMQDEIGSLGILFSSLQEQDLGTYKCSAIYANTQKLETSFTLKAFGMSFLCIF